MDHRVRPEDDGSGEARFVINLGPSDRSGGFLLYSLTSARMSCWTFPPVLIST